MVSDSIARRQPFELLPGQMVEADRFNRKAVLPTDLRRSELRTGKGVGVEEVLCVVSHGVSDDSIDRLLVEVVVINGFGSVGPERFGEVEINPAPETVLEPGDRLVVLADDDGADLARNTAVDGFSRPTGTQPRRKTHRRELRIMIVGWNALGRGLIEQIEGHAASGSSIEVVYDPKLVEPDEIDIPASTEVTVRLAPVTADTRDRFSSREMAEFDTIILLGYRRGMSVAEADSRTLLTMMLLKRGMQSLGSATPRIITELLDAESVDLAYLTGADDYIVSDAITSRLMTQIADRPWRGDALRALYGPHGPSIRLVEVRELGLAGKHTWNEIVAVAYSLGLLAIGWRLASPQGADPVLNPAGGEGLLLDNADNLIVIGGGHGSR